jgi:carbon dioxide concentrating mechanism protein CcmN
MIPLPVAMSSSHRTAVISGDVTVHPTANIGQGVLLHADPGSQLIIGVGACVGAGCVIHAHTGTLFIGDGVILGMGTLVFGTTQVGERACIGADSSLIDVSIAPHTVLPPNSLVDAYGSSAEYASGHPPIEAAAPAVAEERMPPIPITESPVAEPPAKTPEAPIMISINAPIYGKAGLERLLATLRNQR